MSDNHPDTAIYAVQSGPWTVIHNAVRAKAERGDGAQKVTAQTGFYTPGKGFQWTNNPEPPKHVKERAEQAVRAQRRKLGLPV